MAVKNYNVIGIMSGTSLDGIDIAYCKISNENGNYFYELVKTETIPYCNNWVNSLKKAFFQSDEEVSKLSVDYGNYLGSTVNDFIERNKIFEIDFLASHGHTIFHKPDEGITLQIGDGQTICKKTGLKVVCDFRSQDVALGGQGAPLVPIGDKLFFSEYAYCLNLGGFANISFEKKGERIAYDICPVNIVLNYFANELGLEYDNKGMIASKGLVHKQLLEDLNALEYYTVSPPKSLGFEFVKQKVLPLISRYHLKPEDALRTFVEHIVIQISKVLDNVKDSHVLITGGGAFNDFLINLLKEKTANKIVIPNTNLINYKEALIFALLAVLKVENNVNCLASVTGAKKDHSSGKIFL